MKLNLTVANCKNRLCPWSLSKVKRDSLLQYRDHVVGFSSIDSMLKFQAATSHFDDLLAKRRKEMIPQKRLKQTILNTHCPWSHKRVSEDALTDYLNVKVGFCNPECRDMFASAITVFDNHVDEIDAITVEGARASRKKQKLSHSENSKSDIPVLSDDCQVDGGKSRCSWARDEVFHHYHDTEWGVPSRDDDRYLFEMLTLEGAQAGLSWKTILNKREEYKLAFDNFDASVVATYDENKILSLLENKGIVRNKLKVRSVITNAQATLNIREEFGSFSKYLWKFVNDEPIVNSPSHYSDVQTTSPQSDALSKDLKKRGFKFVGSTIMYAYMQAVGMVDDHEHTCPQKRSH